MLAQLGDGPSPGLAPGTCQPVAGTRLHSPKRVAVTKRENRFFLTLVGSLFSRRRNLGGHSLADLVTSGTEEVTQELGGIWAQSCPSKVRVTQELGGRRLGAAERGPRGTPVSSVGVTQGPRSAENGCSHPASSSCQGSGPSDGPRPGRWSATGEREAQLGLPRTAVPAVHHTARG